MPSEHHKWQNQRQAFDMTQSAHSNFIYNPQQQSMHGSSQNAITPEKTPDFSLHRHLSQVNTQSNEFQKPPDGKPFFKVPVTSNKRASWSAFPGQRVPQLDNSHVNLSGSSKDIAAMSRDDKMSG